MLSLFKNMKKIHNDKIEGLAQEKQDESKKKYVYLIQGDTNQDYNYIKEELLDIMGLSNQFITFGSSSLLSSAAVSFFDREGNFAIKICMADFNNPQFYRVSLAHELWHVKTGLELINKVGIDAFRDLVNNQNHEASLAFRTIFEYMAWSECIKNYNEKESGLDLIRIFQNYYQTNSIAGYPENSIVTDIEVCDAIASYFARRHNTDMSLEEFTHLTYIRLQDNYKKVCDMIGDILLNERKWPMEVNEFKEIGDRMKNIFEEYIPLPKEKIIL